VLTVDASLQKAATKAVAGTGAAGVVVVEVNTGRILALVSTPSFDPNVMRSELAGVERERLERDPRRPLENRAVERAYAPASTYKLVTALAGLEAGKAPLDEKVTCHGQRPEPERVLQDMGAHGAVDLIDALRVSCNVYFWTIAERVGLARMHDVARELGYGSRTGIDLAGEAEGNVPDADDSDGRSQMPLLQAAIGNSGVDATVLQVALAYAAIAHGGSLHRPQLVRRIQTADGKVVEEARPILRRQLDFAASSLDIVRRGMWQVVNERGGTAYSIHEGAVAIAGKTGTAPIRERSDARPLQGWDPDVYHAWFAGWAPAERPEIAIAVMVEHGGIGGEVAAPIARRIVDSYSSARQAAAMVSPP
jgi:penicillin-binding protein 2